MIAHQRRIREAMTETHPRPPAPSLTGYSVETISRTDATPIIMHYEWLHRSDRRLFVGLLSPSREIEGVACLVWAGRPDPTADQLARLSGARACVHYAPAITASFLISAACKLVYQVTGTALFFPYGDR
jgi:hypothetical protein